jgi:fido (protein-threonine AMPylation protein)
MVSINEFECKGFHSYIMNDLVPQYRGQWRNTYVTIGGYQPCAPWMIQGEIEEANLFPFEFSSIIDESDIIRWYRQFEIIHPFIDGNGRVGGVIAAIASYWFSKGEYLLAPGQ